MIWDNIPEELKISGLWCCWKYSESKGKIPFSPQTGKMAKSNDKTTFSSFQVALKSLPNYYGFDEAGKVTGGLGLGVFNGFCAIDIDHCISEDQKLSPLARDIIDFCQSYTEISPSGTGIRIIFKTDSELNNDIYYVNNRKIGLEIYLSDQTNKYVTITGDVIYPWDIRKIDISYILEKYMLKNTSTATIKVSSEPVDFDIEKYKNDIKLQELWISKPSGSGGDESEVDMAICTKLAFYLNGDFNAINNAFISSPYFQAKDDKHKEKWLSRNDYREMTIKNAIMLVADNNQSGNEFTLTDTGNAHRFIEMFGETIRYNVDNKNWMYWNGKWWQTDIYNNIKNYAEIVIEEMKMSMKKISNPDIVKAMQRNIKRALQSSGKIAMIKEAEHLEGIPVSNDSFDRDDFLFNTESGIINLKTGIVSPHDKELMLSNYSPYEIDKNPPKLWLKFLNEIFDGKQDVIDYIQRILGYSLTGSTREQCMFILVGDGSNGKSLLLDIVNEALGSYGATSNVDILLEKKNGNTANLGDVARLNKIRYVSTDEAKLGDKLNESAIKTLTSGIGKIVARFLYGNEFEFTTKFKIFMATNYKPIIRGTDHGIWRRIKIIPFNVVIPDEQQDKFLKDKLMQEMPRILWWLIEGCLKWQTEGLVEPKSLKEAAKEYRNEMDVVQKWAEEVCVIRPDLKEKSSILFSNFSNYAKVNKEFQLSHTMFGRNLSKKFKKTTIKGVVYYLGLKPKVGNPYSYDLDKYDNI